MVGSMRSGDSPSASGNNGGLGGPNSNNSGNSNSSSSKGNSPSSSGNNGGLGGPTSNNSGNSGSKSSPSSSGNNGGLGGPTSNNSGNRSSPSGGSSPGGSGGNSNANGGGNGGGLGGGNSSSLGGGNGGLNSAGNRASGAGPGASANRSTTGNGYGGVSSPGVGAGLNSAGNRASGAGPGASSNRTTTGAGYGGTPNSTLSGGMASFNASQDKTRQGDLAQQARDSETQSMKDLARERALGTISKAEVGVKDPYNTLSGGVTADLTSMTVKDAIALSKTQWDGKLANVVGAYQVKDTTLAAVATKMGLMDAKMTPAVQDKIAVGLMQERANKATVNGQIDVDKFAKELSKEWASVADPTTGVSHYAKNGIDKASVSVAAARDMAKDLVANGVVSPNKSLDSITSKDVSSFQTKAPGVDRFSSTYMGKSTSAASVDAARATAQEAAKAGVQNDPSGLPAGNYPAHVVGNGIAPSISTPAKQATPAAPTPTPAPPRQRSLAEKVAAGAIDVGLGMLPGVGTPVSLINGGLALTGNKTLGERIAGSIATGEGGGAGPDSGADRLGGGRGGQVVDNKQKSTVPKSDETFEDRYIKFIDPTPRPKPAQKWDYNTPGYA